MPDPVSYQSASTTSPVVECEPVPIGPELESAADFDCFEAEPGVRSLVEGHVRSVSVPVEPVHADIPYVEIAQHCVSKAIGLATAAESLSPLATLKAGLELAECVMTRINEADENATLARSVEVCEDQGGIATGVILGDLVCVDPSVLE